MAVSLDSRTVIEAAPEDVGVSSSRLQNLSRLARRYVDERKIPGAITMVARRNRIIHFETFGSMDDAAGKPMAADTIFRIYSMTKPIASVALMTLYEEGKFQLNDPVSKYIPEFKDPKVLVRGTADSYETRPAAREMTIRDVLMHTSGMAGLTPSAVVELYQRNDIRSIGSSETLAPVMARLGKMPLLADPGSQFIYGVSTDVVGYLCEIFSGMSLDRFLQQRIFDPLEMVDTSFSVPPSKLERFAANYVRSGKGTQHYVLFDAPGTSLFAKPVTYFSGAAGLTSTASDYMRFCKMLANRGELDGQRIIGSRTLHFMATNHLPGGSDVFSMALSGGPAPVGDGFGLGFAVLIDPTLSQTLGDPGEYYWAGRPELSSS